jgi:hypothetical protein
MTESSYAMESKPFDSKMTSTHAEVRRSTGGVFVIVIHAVKGLHGAT